MVKNHQWLNDFRYLIHKLSAIYKLSFLKAFALRNDVFIKNKNTHNSSKHSYNLAILNIKANFN